MAVHESLEEGARLFHIRRYDRALEEFLKIDASQFDVVDNMELAYYLGLCYTRLNRHDDALLYLEQVVTAALDPLRVYQCRLTLAYIYVITGRSKLAEFELGRLMNGGYESIQIYTTMAYAAWAQKQFQKAVDFYEKALDMDENNATALNGLGYILADSDTDSTRGIKLCRRAVDKRPQNPAYLDSLGWAYFKNGEISEARIWLRRAFELAPHEREIKKHMKIVVGEG
ncbi:MAG: tetratricopeptide repeat protein [Spirochaetaceae bacterium]|jgi:tetratricopeptide (TPR) repeat protein|nr:tetratricopeptide repeat protein [Spirochaetaceae bacterium]